MLFKNQFEGLKPLSPDEYLSESKAAWTDFTESAKSIYDKSMKLMQQNGMSLGDNDENLALNKEMIDLITRHSQTQLECSLRLMCGMPFIMNFTESKASFMPKEASSVVEKKAQKTTVKAKSPVKKSKATSTSAPKNTPELLSKPNGTPDELTKIKGIGPKLSEKLNELGIYHFSQISAWTEKDVAYIDDKLSFKGRIDREKWIEQAKGLI